VSKETGSDLRLASFADNVRNRINSIEITLRLLGLGIDYERYVRFSELTPFIASHGHEDPRGWGLAARHTERSATLDDCQFCFAFVLDSALRLQEAVHRSEA
jgi:hypothetical protein